MLAECFFKHKHLSSAVVFENHCTPQLLFVDSSPELLPVMFNKSGDSWILDNPKCKTEYLNILYIIRFVHVDSM